MQKPTKEAILKRLNRIEGQVRGVKRLVENDTYCVDVITQTSALRSAISAVEDEILRDHLGCCVVEQIKKGQYKKVQEEVGKVYKLARKK